MVQPFDPTWTDPRAALEWITAFHPEPPWVLFEIDPSIVGGAPRAVVLPTPDAFLAHVAARSGVVNVYFTPNRLRPGVSKMVTKEDITGLLALYVDLDLPHGPSGVRQIEEGYAWLVERIRSLDPPPTAIIVSGGGAQGFWLFDRMLAPSLADRVEAASKSIGRSLGSDAVQNVNRLMRLPGTVNVPNAKKVAEYGRIAAPAYVVEADWTRRWSFERDTVPHLPEGVGSYVPSSVSTRPSSGQRRGFEDMSHRLQALVGSGTAKEFQDADKKTDRSRVVASIVASLIRKRWDDDDIVPFLVERQYGSSAHCLSQRDPVSFARRQIERMRERVVVDWDMTPQGERSGASPRNVRRAIEELGVDLSYNEFSNRTYINGRGALREWIEDDASQISVEVYDRFGFTPSERTLRDVRVVLAHAASFHPVREYLDARQPEWDGVRRIDAVLIDLGGAPDTPYVRAVTRMFFVAAVRRARCPGCKFDEMIVLVNPRQGTGKSTFLKRVAVREEWYLPSFSLKHVTQSTARAVEQTQGKWIVECAELQGIYQSDQESFQAFMSTAVDYARLVWRHDPEGYPRQWVMAGTTNSEAFLRGRENRRVWPIPVPKTIDEAVIVNLRDQWWAEAAVAEAAGEEIRLPEELWPAAGAVQEQARYGDPWVDILARALEPIDAEGGRISSVDVWDILGKPGHQRGGHDNGRLTEAMSELGWSRGGEMRVRGGRCFVKGNPSLAVCVNREAEPPFRVAVSYAPDGYLTGADDDPRASPPRHVDPPF